MCFRTVPGNLGMLFRINQDGCKSKKSFLCYNHQKLHKDYNHEVLQQSTLSTEYLHLTILSPTLPYNGGYLNKLMMQYQKSNKIFKTLFWPKTDPIIPNHISEPFAKMKICCTEVQHSAISAL